MVYIIISLIAAYLLGSMPTAYIFAKVLSGVDIRAHGSGNVGATNVARTIGKVPGIIVLVIDILKGFAAVAILPLIIKKIFPDTGDSFNETVLVLLGMAVIFGHIWTVFLKFKGGKGVATTAGAMIALSPVIFGIAIVVWIIVFSIWKYVSLASIVAAITLPIASVITGKSFMFVVFSAVVCMIGIYTHRTNIKRLIQGSENRIVKDKKS